MFARACRYRAAYQDRFHESSLSLSGILCSGLNSTAAAASSHGASNSSFYYSSSSNRNSAASNSQDHVSKEQSRRSRLCLFDNVPVKNLTLRQLRDSVQNLQMHWVQLCVAESMQPEAMEAVDALLHRFGVLASQVSNVLRTCACVFVPFRNTHLHWQAWPLSMMDDQGSIEQADGSSSSNSNGNADVKMNRICIRRFVNVFLGMHRHMHMWNQKQSVEGIQQVNNTSAAFDCCIKLHHILAASDDFSKLSMHWDLMPAAKLNYVHDFRGYFNCISQVAYFHDPGYERRPQERKRVHEISRGIVLAGEGDDGNGGTTTTATTTAATQLPAVQIIPPIMQLYPEVEVEHADDSSNIVARAYGKKWTWVFAGRTVYLVAPPAHSDMGSQDEESIYHVRIMHHKDIAPLLQIYLRETSAPS